VEAGVDAGQLGEQILGYLRDMMTIGVGASVELLRTANPARADELLAAAKRWGTMTLLSAIQILDESLVKMRHSTQSRTILEVAMVQICHLQDLQGLADLIRGLQAGKSPPLVPVIPTTTKQISTGNEKKKLEPIAPVPTVPADGIDEPEALADPQNRITSPSLTNAISTVVLANDNRGVDQNSDADAAETSTHASDASDRIAGTELDASDFTPLSCWERALAQVDGMVADYASMVVKIDCSMKPTSHSGNTSNPWTAYFPQGADLAMQHCNEPTHRKSIEAALQKIVKQPIQLAMQMSNLPPKSTSSAPKPIAPVANQPTLVRKYSEHPLVKSLMKTIDGDIVRVDVKI
jgi:DNA polymerase-3 subunit gamma/tau